MARFLVLLLCSMTGFATEPPTTHHLKATPKTVVWGYYAAGAPPALRIHSGDKV